MKTLEFQGYFILADKVVAVGPVEPDAELGVLAFTIFMMGGVELTLPQGKAYADSRECFIVDLNRSL